MRVGELAMSLTMVDPAPYLSSRIELTLVVGGGDLLVSQLQGHKS